MKKSTKTAYVAIFFFASLFFSCKKETITPIETPLISADATMQEEITLDYETEDGGNTAASRGYCSAHAISVEYEDFFEYEFDIFLDGLGRVHFANNKSGFTKIVTNLPLAVQPRSFTIGNIPNGKKNPKCPWMSKNGVVKVKIFKATKDSTGKWVPVKDSPFITYNLGETEPTEITKWGTRIFCDVGPVGKWFYCTLLK
jgi:hypothetical protein